MSRDVAAADRTGPVARELPEMRAAPAADITGQT
jgi:hypothetical protein